MNKYSGLKVHLKDDPNDYYYFHVENELLYSTIKNTEKLYTEFVELKQICINNSYYQLGYANILQDFGLRASKSNVMNARKWN